MALMLSALFKVFVAVLGVLVVRAMLLWFDGTKSGRDFVDNKLSSWSDEGQSRYYSYRILGACVLVGLALF